MKVERYLYELLRVAIGDRLRLSSCPTDKEWNTIYYICELQEVIGFVFTGILKLPEEHLLFF